MSNNDSDKREKLVRTWVLMADAVVRALEAEAPSAASLEVARKWLEANGCTLDTLRDWRRGPTFEPGELPTFNDDDEDVSNCAPDSVPPALKIIPPFDN
jgi:hypothetical protein